MANLGLLIFLSICLRQKISKHDVQKEQIPLASLKSKDGFGLLDASQFRWLGFPFRDLS